MREIAMRNLLMPICALAVASALSSCAGAAPSGEDLKAYGEAKASYAAGKLEDAEKALLPLAGSRALPQAGFLLGKVRFFLGKYEGAASSFEKLASAFPKYHEAELWLARTYLQQGRLDEANRIAEELIANDSSDLRLYYLEAMLLSAKGDLQGALGFLERSGESGEELSKTYFESARIYYRFGQDDRAIGELKRAKAALSPGSPANEAVDELVRRLGKAGRI